MAASVLAGASGLTAGSVPDQAASAGAIPVTASLPRFMTHGDGYGYGYGDGDGW